MDKVLTIVVPSYQTEPYIDQCLPTMLKHPHTDKMELLLINDGSRDGTLKKLRWYETRYPDTAVVIDKENGGHGSVINLGIQKAKGRYLKIIDGDDWVLAENLGKMICDLETCQEDLVIHPYIKYDVRTKKQKRVSYPSFENQSLAFDQAAPALREVEIHAATYRTDLLRKHRIRVREHCFYEDTEYNIFPIPFVDKVRIYHYPVYVYRTGTASQSINPLQAYKNRSMHRMIVMDCMAYFQACGKKLSPEKRAYIKKIIGKRIRSQYAIYLKNSLPAGGMEELCRWDEQLKEASDYFYRASNQTAVWLLRRNIRRMYPVVKFFYAVYLKLHGRSYE